MKNMLKGFTLIEIMIVVAIIAILAALAIPSFMTYRKQSQATACISNLSQIRNATELYLMSHNDTPSLDALVGTDKQIKNMPICPAGGNYTVGNASTDPTCDFDDGGTDYQHKLPADTAAAAGT